MSFARSAALLALIATVLMLPVMLGPVRYNDSHWINLVWSEQFTALVRQGHPWPRWLPWSHGGLGAPVFYFYGPVTFWLAALAGLAGLATWPALIATATFALWASGAMMLRYLEGTRRPLLGAVLYMALPYHMVDFALRGALAEFTAVALLPLLALGLRRAKRGRPMLLALAYVALIATHLPTALLASLFLVPALFWLDGERSVDAARNCLVGLALGLALAAPYLVPALLLQPAASLETMAGTSALDASQWHILSADPRIRHGMVPIAAMAGVSALIALVHLRRDRWAWAVVAAALLAIGLPPALWHIAPLAKVQFPWRLLTLVEFGAACIVGRSALPVERLALLVAPALIFSLMIVTTTSRPDAAPVAELQRGRHPDMIEYLPPGAGERSGAWSKRALVLAAAHPAPRRDGAWTIAPTFAFPAWHARCAGGAVTTSTDRMTGLLRYRGRNCRIETALTVPERIGWAIVLLALAVLAASVFIRRACRAWPEAPPAAP